MNSNRTSPPPVARWLLKRLLRYEYRYAVVGDFEEIYNEILEEHDRRHALLWYWCQIIKSTPSFIENSFYWSIAMFKSYFKVALRNMQRHKLFSFINISGLAIGMACCIMVALFVQHELSYDMFHKNVERIYRVGTESPLRDEWFAVPLTGSPIGPGMVEEFPEVVKIVRIDHSTVQKALVRYKDRRFFEEGFYIADPSVFDFFNFPLIAGDKNTALNDPYAVVISEDIAQKYFGVENPLGKTLSIDLFSYYDNEGRYEFTVTGVMKNIPDNSHIKFNILGSMLGAVNVYNSTMFGEWNARYIYTYVLLRENSSPAGLEDKLTPFLRKNLREVYRPKRKLYIEPLTSIYPMPRDTRYMYIVSAIALFILLIACINFMNLSTALSLTRAREISVRKVVGANRSQLIKQFMGESVLFSLFALLLALFLAKLLLPVFNIFVGKNLQFDILQNPLILAASFCIALFVGMLSGSYPALFLSAFQLVSVMRGTSKTGQKRFALRNVLVVFQFAISVVFIICTIITINQMRYISNKKLGFDKEQVVLVTLNEPFSLEKLESLKSRLKGNANVVNASYSTSVPFTEIDLVMRLIEYVPEENKIEGQSLWAIFCDYDFIETLGIKVRAGRNFSRNYPADASKAIIINESAAKSFDMEFPIGNQIALGTKDDKKLTIIGIIEDFHFHPLQGEIRPLIISVIPSSKFRTATSDMTYKYFSVKIHPGNIHETLEFLKKTMYEFSPGYPFDYTFIDDKIEALLRNEQRLIKIFMTVSFLAIFISCLGLFGLAAFSAERRTKEIGIRKVLGASVSGIVLLLTKEFAKWVILANVISWPVAYLIMNRWMQNFAYRINFGWWVFILAGILTLAIALITISYQSIKAATANPIDSLRFE